MVFLVAKLGTCHMFPSRLDGYRSDSRALSADALLVFRGKISDFVNQVLLKPEPGYEVLYLSWFHKCFELINISNRAFAEMVMEIGYPMSKWGSEISEEYLNYSMNLLDLLNLLNSSASHLNHAKVSVLHALSLIKNSTTPPSGFGNLKKLPKTNLVKDFKMVNSVGVEESSSGSEKEIVALKALMVLKKMAFLALGLVLSGLCSDSKPYMKIRECVRVSDDPLTKGLDSRLCKEITESHALVVEVKEVNRAVDLLCEKTSNCGNDEAIKKLKKKLEVIGNSIDGIEKDANKLFSQVLATRNKLLGNIRLTGKHN